MSNTPTHGSDVQETPDWWKASDGRFYPPELHPDYVKPVAPTAAAAPPEELSLADRLRAEADRVGDEASAAAEASVASIPNFRETAGGDDGAASAAAAAASMIDDPKSTIPASAPEVPLSQQTIIQRPGMPIDAPSMPPVMPSPSAPPSMPPVMPPSPNMPPAMPPSPGAPPAMPPSPGFPPAMPASPNMPPSPGAPPSMPPAPTSPPAMPPSPMAPAPLVEQGPGGITYTAPADTSLATLGPPIAQSPAAFQPPTSAPSAKASSGASGIIALVAGAAAIAGSLLQWGKGTVTGANGAEKAIIEVAGFDSSGIITAICGGVLLLAGILFFMGVPKQLNWAILAFLGGAVIVGAVVFSMIDIGDLSNRYATQWQSQGLASVGDVISTQADLGLWITGAGGVLGVLAAPFANRS